MKKLAWSLFCVSIGFTTAAPAQQLEEVIVTAQRREESLQDVPVAITAFTAAQLKAQNISEAKDYLMMTPNVSFTEDGEMGQRSVGISIRGISDFANTITDVGGLSSSFGVYLDEFNVANSANRVANPQLQDLERIEILRGPQGTYFGRNATGGALNLTTALPRNEFEYEVGAGFGSFDTWEIHAMFNAPLTDRFFVRGVGWYEESAGFLRNLSPTGNDDAYDHMNVRAALRWLITDNLTADFSIMRTKEDDGTDSNVNSGVMDSDTAGSTPTILQIDPSNPDVFAATGDVLPVDSGAGFYPRNDRTINKDFFETNEGEATVYNLRLNYAGDGWSLRSITGYMDSEHRRFFDQDLTQYSLYETVSGRQGKTFSEELRFRMERDTWDLTLGGLYAEDSVDTYAVIGIGDLGFNFIDPADLAPDGTIPPDVAAACPFCLAPGDIITGPEFDVFESTSWAIFGEANWRLTDQLKLTVGVRYTDDDIDIRDYNAVGPAGGFDAVPYSQLFNFNEPDPVNGYGDGVDFFGSANTGSSAVTPRFVLSWKPHAALTTYASASAGYKPGGTKFVETDDGIFEEPFDNEEVWNYELGAKWDGLDGRLRINGAVFYMDWKDLQIPTVEVGIVDNAVVSNFRIANSEAESKGFEVEVQALPTNNLLIGGAVGYLDATFESFDADDPFIFQNVGFALRGETLPRAPEWTGNVFGQIDQQLGSLDGWIRAEWVYRSSIKSDIEAVVSLLEPLDNALTQELGLGTDFSQNGVDIPLPRAGFPLRVPAFDVVNLRAGIRGERWALSAYVENLLDENYYTGTQENFGLGGYRLRPHFRVYGVNVTFSSN